MGWKEKLKLLVDFYGSKRNLEFSLNTWFHTNTPEMCDWPNELPISEGLKAFYDICGSGHFGHNLIFVPLSQLSEYTESWIEDTIDEPALTSEEWDIFLESGDEHPEGTIKIFENGQHIIFAVEGNGTPWVLDVLSNKVAAYYFKGGSWERSFDSFDDFMEHVMSPELEEYDSGWGKVLSCVPT